MKVNVKAAPGLICPAEGMMINDKKAVEVEATTAVQRLINDGSLIIANEGESQKAAKPARRNKDA